MYINGKNVYTLEDVKSFLRTCGLDDMDMQDLLSLVLKLTAADNNAAIEGLVKDDLYEMEHAVRCDIEEVMECVDSLLSPSRKGNTKADIAARLKGIAENIEAHSQVSHVYTYHELFGKDNNLY